MANNSEGRLNYAVKYPDKIKLIQCEDLQYGEGFSLTFSRFAFSRCLCARKYKNNNVQALIIKTPLSVEPGVYPGDV